MRFKRDIYIKNSKLINKLYILILVDTAKLEQFKFWVN